MADTLKDDLLPLIDELRGLPGEFGFRTAQVWARTVEWGGPRAGIGTRTVTDTRLLVGGQDPKVTELRRKDAVAGSSEKIDAEYEIGPLTPEFAGGGVSDETLNPTGTPATEFFFVIKGPGLPADGLLCRREGGLVGKPFRRVVRVRGVGRKATS